MSRSKKLLAALLTVGCVHQAHAVIAFSMAPPFSYLMAVLGGLNVFNGVSILGRGNAPIGALVMALGIMVLDEKSQQVHFQPLNTQSSAAMGISPDEALAYNGELPLINVAFEETARQISASFGGGSPGMPPEMALDLWKQNAADAGVSAHALVAVQKISRNSLQ